MVGCLRFSLRERVNHEEAFRGWVNQAWVFGRSVWTFVRRESGRGVLVSEWVYLVHRTVREHETYCMGAGIGKWSWLGGKKPCCRDLETCCGKKLGPLRFSSRISWLRILPWPVGVYLQQDCVLLLLEEGRKDTHFYWAPSIPGLLPLISFCRSEKGNTERLSNMPAVTQPESGRTREASFTSHLWPCSQKQHLTLFHRLVASILWNYFVLYDTGFDPSVICNPVWWQAMGSQVPFTCIYSNEALKESLTEAAGQEDIV